MNEMLIWGLTLVWGALLGALFFGGLWWTVHRIVESQRPVLLFVGSLLIRTTLVLAGFYIVADGHWPRLLACLLGFVFARFIVSRLIRQSANHPAAEASHAP